MLLFNDLIKYIKSEVKRFQNISCYCLTTRDIKALADDTLFQNISCYCLTFSRYMTENPTWKFQNISCYCLTTCGRRLVDWITISKHLMLLFNLDLDRIQKNLCWISKHLMLLFNRSLLLCFYACSCHFKTSHVIV